MHKIRTVFQIGPAEAFPSQLRAAAQAAFPAAEWREEEDFSALAESGSEGRNAADPAPEGLDLLILSEDFPQANQAGTVAPEKLLDAEQLPRWAVLRFGGGGETPGVWSREPWTVPQLAGLLRNAASQLATARENARLRGDLLTMARRVSHDLRTPLGGILATVDMLAEIVPDGADEVRPVLASVDEITKIINRTSFLLRAIAQPAAKVPLGMGEIVQEAVMRLERPITQRQALILRPPPGDWPQVSGVESWLQTIWWNLLHNALQHSGADAPRIELGWEALENGEGHRFWIHNSGPGIRAAAQANLFQSFHLLHDPNAARGLGLPIVRSLVELLGGECGWTAGLPAPGGETVDTDSSAGTRFWFTLP